MTPEEHKKARTSQLAIQRHNFKNQLVKLKAKDEVSTYLLKKIDEGYMTLEEVKIFLQNGMEHRAEKRKELNNMLDTMGRVNSKGEY